MANTNRPFGLRPIGTLGSACYTGKVQKFYVPATDVNAIYVGDTVKIAGSSGSLYAGDPSYPTAAIAAANDVVLGVMVGIEALPTNLAANYRIASTGMYIYVDTDPNTIYEAQSDSTGVAAADVGLNVPITVTAGSTTTGVSGSVLAGASVATTNSLDCQILRLAPNVDNEAGAYSKCHVRLNLNQYKTNTTGIA